MCEINPVYRPRKEGVEIPFQPLRSLHLHSLLEWRSERWRKRAGLHAHTEVDEC